MEAEINVTEIVKEILFVCEINVSLKDNYPTFSVQENSDYRYPQPLDAEDIIGGFLEKLMPEGYEMTDDGYDILTHQVIQDEIDKYLKRNIQHPNNTNWDTMHTITLVKIPDENLNEKYAEEKFQKSWGQLTKEEAHAIGDLIAAERCVNKLIYLK